MKKFNEIVESVMNEGTAPKVGDKVVVVGIDGGKDRLGKVATIKPQSKEVEVSWTNSEKVGWNVEIKHLIKTKEGWKLEK